MQSIKCRVNRILHVAFDYLQQNGCSLCRLFHVVITDEIVTPVMASLCERIALCDVKRILFSSLLSHCPLQDMISVGCPDVFSDVLSFGYGSFPKTLFVNHL
jgi:hypothetical protein